MQGALCESLSTLRRGYADAATKEVRALLRRWRARCEEQYCRLQLLPTCSEAASPRSPRQQGVIAKFLTQTLPCIQLTVREALNSALDEEMQRDDQVFLMGEEVLSPPERLAESYSTSHHILSCQRLADD